MFPLVGGFLFGWLAAFRAPEAVDPNAGFGNALIVFLFAFIGALLLRSWWALLIVPVADMLGQIGANLVLAPLVQGGWLAVQERFAQYFSGGIWMAIGGLGVMWILSLIGTAGIGIALGKWLQKHPWNG